MRNFLPGAQEVIVSDDMGANDTHAAHAAQVDINLLREALPEKQLLEMFFEFITVRLLICC
jgi:hypothetical protein